ncbi:hypothetical protein C8Z91_24860 [Paenibacillus elgii]|uniref:DUF4303 domain-containing protein n=1 Tax=Paenibacillus elgii TaxID=189691 RepID=A0A2T6FXI2_9BACL|nr:hypothetical protein [Paenibacillus elgii]PUA36615.1 hypothetical protein C8Z91_24860 [Paenibacillus elgii]
MNEPDWKEVEERLFQESVSAIKQFSAEHANEEICYFAFDSEPYYGYVLLCFDTTENSVIEAKRSAERALDFTAQSIEKGMNWQMANSYMTGANLLPFTNNTGDFKYQGYTQVDFQGWQEFADSDAYPKGYSEDQDYLEGNLSIVFWKVIDRLIRENHFSVLKMASPFFVGYGFHDKDQVLLRIINWGNEEGKM